MKSFLSFTSLIGITAGTLLSATVSFAQEQPAPKASPLVESLKYKQGDEQGNEKKALQTELLITLTETKAIEQLNILINKHHGTPMEPGLMFRLGEMHMRRAKSSRFFEMIRKSDMPMSSVPSVVKDSSSKGDIQKAIAIYDRIQTGFPYFRQMDYVLFNSGFARQQIGEYEKSEALYSSLIKRFPSSDMVPDCYLAIGEMNFDKKKFEMALDNFLKVKDYPESRVYPYGLYKAAWSYYNLRDSASAMKSLELVVAFGRMVQEKGLDSKLDLRKEALADMTVFYEGVYDAKDAFRYFKKQAGDLDVGPIIIRLADIYERYSRFKEREIVLREFIAEMPNNPQRPRAHDSLVMNYENMRLRPEAVSELKKFEKMCDTESSWSKFQQKEAEKKKERTLTLAPYQKPEPDPDCMQLLSDTSIRLADKWLKMWRKETKLPLFAEVAEDAFRTYLNTAVTMKIDDKEEATKARFAYAELLFQRNKFREASEQYALVTGKTTEKTLVHDAGYAAVVSLQKAVGEKWSDKDEKTFKVLALDYVKKNPAGKFRLDVEFQQGLIAYEKTHYEEAMPIFLTLGDKFAKEEKGQKAQDLYMDILNIKKDFSALKAYADKLLVRKPEDARRSTLVKVYEEAYFAEIQRLEETGKDAEAIKGYKAFAQKNLKSQLASRAWWNALQIEVRLGLYRDIAPSAQKFYEYFPQDAKAKEALLRSAQTYESMGQLKEAADVLLTISRIDKKDETQWTMLAADFLALGVDREKAKSLYRKLLILDAKLAPVVMQKLYGLERDVNDKKRLLHQMASNGTQPQAGWAQIQLLEETYKTGKPSDAFAEARKVISSPGATPSVKARARFIQARVLEDEFRAQSVKAQVSKIEMVLAMKTEKLDKAQQAYQEAIRYGDARVSLEAMEHLAGCYMHYADALNKMVLPNGISNEEESVFRKEMEKLAMPMTEKGVESMQLAVEHAKKMKLRDGTIARLQNELNKLNMRDGGSVYTVESPEMALPKFSGVGS